MDRVFDRNRLDRKSQDDRGNRDRDNTISKRSKITTTTTATTSNAITIVNSTTTTAATDRVGFAIDPKSEQSLDRVRDSVEHIGFNILANIRNRIRLEEPYRHLYPYPITGYLNLHPNLSDEKKK